MRERVHVNRTMKDLVADLRLMKSVLLSQYMPFLFAQRQEIGFPSRTEIDVPSPKTLFAMMFFLDASGNK